MAEEAPILPPDPEADELDPAAELAESAPGVYTCPHCLETVDVDPLQRRPFINCPHCGGQFAITSDASDEDDEARTAAEEEAASRERELDGMRIRQLSTGRRAAIRAQGYFVVGLCGSLIGILACAIEVAKQIRAWHAATPSVIGLIVGIVALLWLSRYFFRRWRAIADELSQPLLEEPTTPPDFSELSDGTQQLKHLEDLK